MRRLLLLGCVSALWACVSPAPVVESRPEQPAAAPTRPVLEPYFATLESLAVPDTARQAAALAELREAWQLAPAARSKLRYALALGAAGHDGSDPVEARRLVNEALLEAGALEDEERALAQVLLREFEARITQYAELARQREAAQRQLANASGDQSRRADALAQDNARLRRELAQAEGKLQAIAEMERSLAEQAEPPVATPVVPPVAPPK